jgi:alkylation response protein AidB-like acyl-CoA dehydrogenase
MTSAIDSATLEMTLDAVRDFVTDALPDEKLLALDEADEFPHELVRQLLGEGLGIQLVFIPMDFGGMGGGAFDIYRVCEQMARIDLGVATGVLATFLGSDPIRVGGTPEQQAHWMGRLAEEGLLMAYAATEPAAGSDLGALKTRAEPVRANGAISAYRITGAKQSGDPVGLSLKRAPKAFHTANRKTSTESGPAIPPPFCWTMSTCRQRSCWAWSRARA